LSKIIAISLKDIFSSLFRVGFEQMHKLLLFAPIMCPNTLSELSAIINGCRSKIRHIILVSSSLSDTTGFSGIAVRKVEALIAETGLSLFYDVDKCNSFFRNNVYFLASNASTNATFFATVYSNQEGIML